MPRAIKTNHRLALGLAAAILACLGPVARADAGTQVYWAHFGGSTLESVPADGSEPPQVLASGASNPLGVAVDATHIYWANYTGDSISRANLDGTGVEKEFISGVNAFALAVTKGHIYWTDVDADSIGRANLDGSEVDQGLIEDVGAFFGLAADSGHLYWGNQEDEAIGRANLDGSEVEREFIKPAGPLTPYGVAVDSGQSTGRTPKTTRSAVPISVLAKSKKPSSQAPTRPAWLSMPAISTGATRSTAARSAAPT